MFCAVPCVGLLQGWVAFWVLHFGFFSSILLPMRRIPCPIAQDELRRLTHEEKLTDEEIAALVPDGTVKRVRSWRKWYDIPTLPRWQRNEVTPIEGQLRSLLVGSMLGDGRLVRQTNATHYTERHCGAQRDYLEWKAVLWGPWAGEITPIPDKRGFSQFGFLTCGHALLNDWQELFYASKGKGWKRLVPQIVDMVDEFALAIWYLDDGSVGWWPTITFGADPESREVAWSIFEKFGLKPRWDLKIRNTGCFYMEREDTAHRFLDLIRPHVPDCMDYKLGPFGFEGRNYQIRQKMPSEVLRELAEKNVSIKEIARRLGVGATTVSRRLEGLGIPHQRKIGPPRHGNLG